MKRKPQDIEKAAQAALRACLDGVPFARVVSLQRRPRVKDMRPDIVAGVKIDRRTVKLVAEIRDSGQPRIARDAANQLVRYVGAIPKSYGIFIAPYITPATAKICARDGLGYLDLSGNCRISFENVFVQQTGQPNLFLRKRYLRSPYTPKAQRVLRVLLADPGRAWKTVELATEARVSVGQIANVKKELADREWIRITDKGFALSMPGDLLTEWAQAYDFKKNDVRALYSLTAVPEIETVLAAELGQRGIEYAMTAFSAAARLAPSVRYRRAAFYVADLPGDMLSKVGLKPVGSGANVDLVIPYDSGVFYGSRQVGGITIASPVQVYLDLLSYKARGEEAAEAIKRDVLEKSW